jgi:hypothetical protein
MRPGLVRAIALYSLRFRLPPLAPLPRVVLSSPTAKLRILAFRRASMEMTPVRHLARVHSILPGLLLRHLGLRLRPDEYRHSHPCSHLPLQPVAPFPSSSSSHRRWPSGRAEGFPTPSQCQPHTSTTDFYRALMASKMNLGYGCLRMTLTRAGIPTAVIPDTGLYRHGKQTREKSSTFLSVWPEAST